LEYLWEKFGLNLEAVGRMTFPEVLALLPKSEGCGSLADAVHLHKLLNQLTPEQLLRVGFLMA